MARITPDVPQRGAARNLLNVVDNYYRPARDRMGEAAMSRGLQDVSRVLGNEAGKAKEEQLKEISLQAQQDAMQGLDPDVELSEVRNGFLFRSNSKAYNQTYNETMGKKAAIEFKEKAALDYEKSGLKYNTNPEKFREWMNDRVHGFLKSPENQNPYFLAGAMPYVEQTAFNLGAAHTSNVSRQMERNHIAALQKQAADVAMSAARGEISIDEVINQMSGLNNQAYGTGLSGPTSRKALISAYLTVADASDNQEMITALLDAQESGQLRLTPEEWNSATQQGMAIERDINFRKAQQERAAAAQEKSEVTAVTEAITDFYIDPNNAGITFPQFLNAPVGDNGETMADMIANSPNSTKLMTEAKSAHETMNSVYEIGKGQELSNNAAISNAFTEGEINNVADLVGWMRTAQNDGLRLNDANMTFAYGQLEKITDPSSPYNSQAYKDYRKPAVNRIIGALTPSEDIIKSLSGEYVGGMSDDITMRFNEYLEAEFAAMPDGQTTNSKAVREAIEAAEAATMGYYRETDPEMFEERRQSYVDAVNKNKVSITSNREFLRVTQQIEAEQRAYDAEQDAIIAGEAADETTPFTRPDLEIQKGSAILFGGDEEADTASVEVPEPEYTGNMGSFDQQLLLKTLSDAVNDPAVISKTVEAFEERYGAGSAAAVLEQLGLTNTTR